jgi:hypothetical protein
MNLRFVSYMGRNRGNCQECDKIFAKGLPDRKADASARALPA